ncbi:hypothetical protein [Clostridium perfringens]|uniref:hypothetical protein n=1 Tax=Clostridium perfringens TaxID=1502 RepID=UPI0024BD46E5|nr:hypothetical protein [Clostridium perfringens]
MKKGKISLMSLGLIMTIFIGCGSSTKKPNTNTNTNTKNKQTYGTITSKSFPPDKQGELLQYGDFMNIDNIYRVKVSDEGEDTEIRIFFDVNVYANPENEESLKEKIKTETPAKDNIYAVHSSDISATQVYNLSSDGCGNNKYDIPIPTSTELIKRGTMYIEDNSDMYRFGNGFELQYGQFAENVAGFYIEAADVTDVSLDEYIKIKYDQIVDEYKPSTDFTFTQVGDVTVKYLSVEPGEDNTLICEYEVTNNSKEDLNEQTYLRFAYYRPGKAIEFEVAEDSPKEFPLKAGERKVIKHILSPVYGENNPINPEEVISSISLETIRGPRNLHYEEECITKIK